MRFAGLKQPIIGAFFALAALAQSAAADPVYHLGPRSGDGPIGTFLIPSVAQGLLFYLDGYASPTDITLTGVYGNFGEKLHCMEVTHSTFACSTEGALDANGRGTGGGSPPGYDADANAPNGDDPTTHFVNGSGGDPASLFQYAGGGNDPLLQIVSFGNDSPAGPTSVPEPGSLILLVGALLIFSATTGRLSRT